LPVDEVEDTNKSQAPKAWYQLLPKYHLLAGAALVLLVIGLWNMDISQKKEESIDLTLEPQVSEQANAENNLSIEQDSNEGYLLIEENESFKERQERVQEREVATIEPVEEANIINNKVVELEKPEQQPAVQIVEVSVEKTKISPLKEEQVRVKKPVVSKQKVDWSPYQSNAWIIGLNKKYYTLQLMASHNATGIRGFLSKRGVSSQYAVYTTQKNGKPWHVIIYGVYESHNFADMARNDLPAYLKNYSPWIRTVADVQNSLK